MPPALPAPSARVGPFSVLDMADFREKRTKDPERELHLSGQQQKSATAHSQESNTPLPKRLSIIPVFPLTVCAVDHIGRSPNSSRTGDVPCNAHALHAPPPMSQPPCNDFTYSATACNWSGDSIGHGAMSGDPPCFAAPS